MHQKKDKLEEFTLNLDPAGDKVGVETDTGGGSGNNGGEHGGGNEETKP